jgi:hypothetical protein
MEELSEALFTMVTVLSNLLNKLPSNAVAIRRRRQGYEAADEDAVMP